MGIKKWGIPTRKQGAEKERLGHLLFGYVLRLDKWLLGIPMQFVLLDLGHIDLGFDPKNEILRVYSYLGEKTPVKEWLAVCLWYNLCFNDLYNKSSTWNAGLIRHKNLLKVADQAGINVHEWMDSVLGNDSRNSNGR